MSTIDDLVGCWGDCQLLTEYRLAALGSARLPHLWQVLKMQEKLPAQCLLPIAHKLKALLDNSSSSSWKCCYIKKEEGCQRLVGISLATHSVVSNPQRPHGLQPTRLLHPWDFPGKSTGVGCHCLLLLSRRHRFNSRLNKAPASSRPLDRSAWTPGPDPVWAPEPCSPLSFQAPVNPLAAAEPDVAGASVSSLPVSLAGDRKSVV